MKRRRFDCAALFCGAIVLMATAGCGTLPDGPAEVGLAGLGGAVGYEVSNQKIGGAAVGAAAGYIAAKSARNQIRQSEEEAEKRGYDRALNQAVKQQYWIIQNQQQGAKTQMRTATMIPITIPETNTNGVIRNESVAYVPVEP
jgi:flavin-dependent dehydrogenase